ncbi:MAG: ABC transporter permease [Firmicutes bacterium ZCTH02-B6]|nr:MAG: ABC transporter permease [Firmicutes bacterium ZCTH02-B6]
MLAAWRRLVAEPPLFIAVLAVFALLALFVIYPIFKVVEVSLVQPDGSWSLATFRTIFSSWYMRAALTNTLVTALIVAVLATAIGFAFAFAVTRTNIPFKGLLNTIAILPVISPPFVWSVAIIMLFGRNGFVTSKLLGLHDFNIYGMHGLVFAQVVTFFPVAYMTLKGVLESLDNSLEEAALDLGASRWHVFRKVTLPLARPGLASAALIVFIESMADFGNPLILSGSHFPTLAVQAYLQVTGMFDLRGGAALAVALLVPSLVAFVVQKYWVSRRRYVTVTGKPTGRSYMAVSRGAKAFLIAVTGLVSLLVISFYVAIAVGAFARLWGFDHSFTWRNFEYVFGVGREAILDTLVIAVASTPVAGILGMVIAFLVVRQRFPGRSTMEFVSLLDYALPGTLIGIGYVLAFNTRPLALTGTFAIIALHFIFRYMPLGIQAGVASLQQIHPSIEEAAINLGASTAQTFRKVTLPLVAPAFFSGLVFSFVRAMTAVSGAIFLVSADWQLMTVQILSQVGSGRLGAAAAFSMVLLAIILLATGTIRLLLGRAFGAAIQQRL